MTDYFHKKIKNQFCEITRSKVIQKLWSGYGLLSKVYLKNSNNSSVIVKHIQFPKEVKHPKGWNTKRSHLRKSKSYEVELAWYNLWAEQCDDSCRVAKHISSISHDREHFLILEDLDAAGFPIRKTSLNLKQLKLGLNWLANFHAIFMGKSPESLWNEGSYWHLSTRPDEWEAMEESQLKHKAKEIDQMLSTCKYQTIIHGDAKVTNFCFSKDINQIAAVDFQYVGGGCGMKDIIYFLGSCLTEFECEKYEEEALNYYFEELEQSLRKRNKTVDFIALEKEWRGLYPIAWTDFSRFLLGWMPTHQKLNRYSDKLLEETLKVL